jgi:hypothetical protein
MADCSSGAKIPSLRNRTPDFWLVGESRSAGAALPLPGATGLTATTPLVTLRGRGKTALQDRDLSRTGMWRPTSISPVATRISLELGTAWLSRYNHRLAELFWQMFARSQRAGQRSRANPGYAEIGNWICYHSRGARGHCFVQQSGCRQGGSNRQPTHHGWTNRP